jgi:ribonuclease HI
MRFESPVAIYLVLLMAMSVVSRTFSFVTSRRINASVFWNRFSSTQVKLTQDDNRDGWASLSRTEIRKLKVGSLREELAIRGLETTGTRPVLVSRLLEDIPSHTTSPSSATRKQTCDASLHPDRTYVLRVTSHKSSSYSSSGAGLVLYDAESVREVWAARKYFPTEQTPFEAEYRSVISGLQYALEHGATKIVLQTDNNVLLRQIRGEYKVNKEHLQTLCTVAVQELEKFKEYNLTPISAAENKRVKNLAQQAVDTKKSVGLPEEEIPDEIESSIPEQAALSEEEEETGISPEKTYVLRFDGGARGNPGTAGSGMVLYDEDMHELWCGWKYLGDTHTNNEAEYNSLLLGMQCARSLGITKLRAEGDSLLIVQQLKGVYRVRHPRLKPLFQACRDVIDTFDFFQVEHIARAANSRADQLANQAMDTKQHFGFEEFDKVLASS